MLRGGRKGAYSLFVFVPLVLSSFTIFLGSILSSSIALADDSVVDEISIKVPVSCSMSGTGMNSHTATLVNGTYTPDIGTTILHAFCNDNEGFAIYAAGYTGNDIGTINSNKLVGTSASNNATIETGLATSAGSPDISNWAMKLTATQDSGDTSGTNTFTIDSAPNTSGGQATPFSQYHVVPNEYTKVAHKNSATDMTATTGGVKLTTTYAAYISKTQVADTYSGQVIYTLVHPSDASALPQPQQATAGCINYFANANNVEGTMGCQPATDGNTTSLLASNFSRSGYGFAGWSDRYDYAINSSANFYGPQEEIVVPTGTTANGLSLYAVWIQSEGSIQDATKVAQVCNSLTQSSPNSAKSLANVSALTDQRDNQTYAIAKLADGNCWMIENLRLNNTAEHNSDGALAQGYGVSATYGNFSGLASVESTNFSNSTAANSLYYSGTQSGGATINIGTNGDPGYRMPRYNNLNTQNRAINPNSNVFVNDAITGGMYSYGNYYTWNAVVANLSYYNSNNQSVSNTSLCPTGWRLPIGGNKLNEANNEIWNLVVTHLNGGTTPSNYSSSDYPYYNGASEASSVTTALRAYPTNYIYAGYMTASAYYRGSYGRYWTSTAATGIGSYYLGLSGTDVTPATDYSQRFRGFTIRCVAMD